MSFVRIGPPMSGSRRSASRSSIYSVLFTLAVRNFISYATVLVESVKRHMPDENSILTVCDAAAGPADCWLHFGVPTLDDQRVSGMAERHNVTGYNVTGYNVTALNAPHQLRVSAFQKWKRWSIGPATTAI